MLDVAAQLERHKKERYLNYGLVHIEIIIIEKIAGVEGQNGDQVDEELYDVTPAGLPIPFDNPINHTYLLYAPLI